MPAPTSSTGAIANSGANGQALQAIKCQIDQLMGSTQELAALFQEASTRQQRDAPASEPDAPLISPSPPKPKKPTSNKVKTSAKKVKKPTSKKVKTSAKKVKKPVQEAKGSRFLVRQVHRMPWDSTSKVQRYTVGIFSTEIEARHAAEQDYVESAGQDLTVRALKWRDGRGNEKSLGLKGKIGIEDAEVFTVTVKELRDKKKEKVDRVAPSQPTPSKLMPRLKEVFVVHIEERMKTKARFQPLEDAQLVGYYTYGIFANVDNAIHHAQKQCEHHLENLQQLGDAHIAHDQAGTYHYFATVFADEADAVYIVKVLEEKLQHKRKMT